MVVGNSKIYDPKASKNNMISVGVNKIDTQWSEVRGLSYKGLEVSHPYSLYICIYFGIYVVISLDQLLEATDVCITFEVVWYVHPLDISHRLGYISITVGYQTIPHTIYNQWWLVVIICTCIVPCTIIVLILYLYAIDGNSLTIHPYIDFKSS